MVQPASNEWTLAISGMSCASCSNRVEKALAKVPGVISVEVNLALETAQVVGVKSKVKPELLIHAVVGAGYQASLIYADTPTIVRVTPGWPVLLAVLLSSPMLLAMLGQWLGWQVYLPALLQWILATPVQFWLGWCFYKAGWRALKAGVGNMDLLVALGTSAAYGLSVYLCLNGSFGAKQHLYFESSSIVISLVLLGKWLESRAKQKTTASIRALNALRPERASVLRDGKELLLPIAQVRLGDVVLVRPGERIAVDGYVNEGES